jgi:hypothetical protein
MGRGSGGAPNCLTRAPLEPALNSLSAKREPIAGAKRNPESSKGKSKGKSKRKDANGLAAQAAEPKSPQGTL